LVKQLVTVVLCPIHVPLGKKLVTGVLFPIHVPVAKQIKSTIDSDDYNSALVVETKNVPPVGNTINNS
jgi:hypothetical protein